MKICMLTNTYLPHVGGVARSVHTFAEDYRREGHEVLVVAPTYPGTEEMPPEIEQQVVRLAAVQQFNGSDFSFRLPLTWMMNPVMREFEPDIVHSHHPYVIGDTALRYAADKNAPVVFTHHTLHEEYTHNVPFDSPTLKQFVIELCTEYANLCDAVIAPSESIASLLRDRGVNTPIAVIPTGIDLGAFASGNRAAYRQRQGIPETAFVVGHLGRLAPEKNLEYLGRAVARFLEQHPEAYFLVVGEGNSGEMLRDLFAKAGLTSRLLMPGKHTGQDLYDAYAAMDLFAFSSHSETQGMVLVEAMAAGLPVVALNASGVREVVTDQVNGFLLEAAAPEPEFAARLEELYSHPDRRLAFSADARKTAAGFSREDMAARALALYRAVLRQTRRRRNEADENEFKALRNRLEVEWALVSEKAGAVLKALSTSTPEPANTP